MCTWKLLVFTSVLLEKVNNVNLRGTLSSFPLLDYIFPVIVHEDVGFFLTIMRIVNDVIQLSLKISSIVNPPDAFLSDWTIDVDRGSC